MRRLTLALALLLAGASAACVPTDPELVWYDLQTNTYSGAEVRASVELQHRVQAHCVSGPRAAWEQMSYYDAERRTGIMCWPTLTEADARPDSSTAFDEDPNTPGIQPMPTRAFTEPSNIRKLTP